MDKKELYQYVGSMQQMVYIRKVTCEEGRSTGLRMFDVKNECLQYQVMCDKCLDVAGFSYKNQHELPVKTGTSGKKSLRYQWSGSASQYHGRPVLYSRDGEYLRTI